MMAETQKAFRVVGSTDEVTECEHCGRQDLKRTVVLDILDADGNTEGRTYFGATCGAKAVGWTAKEFRGFAAAADRAALEAKRQARLARMESDAEKSEAQRGTLDCPTWPTICVRTRSHCAAHKPLNVREVTGD